jgi:hypothetical protein
MNFIIVSLRCAMLVGWCHVTVLRCAKLPGIASPHLAFYRSHIFQIHMLNGLHQRKHFLMKLRSIFQMDYISDERAILR